MRKIGNAANGTDFAPLKTVVADLDGVPLQRVGGKIFGILSGRKDPHFAEQALDAEIDAGKAIEFVGFDRPDAFGLAVKYLRSIGRLTKCQVLSLDRAQAQPVAAHVNAPRIAGNYFRSEGVVPTGKPGALQPTALHRCPACYLAHIRRQPVGALLGIAAPAPDLLQTAGSTQPDLIAGDHFGD